MNIIKALSACAVFMACAVLILAAANLLLGELWVIPTMVALQVVAIVAGIKIANRFPL